MMIGGTIIALSALTQTEPRPSGEMVYTTAYQVGKLATMQCVDMTVEKLGGPYLLNIRQICDNCREALTGCEVLKSCEESMESTSSEMIERCKENRAEGARGAKEYCETQPTWVED